MPGAGFIGNRLEQERRTSSLFPDAEVLHVEGADHFGLLNHPRVGQALRD